MCHWLYIYGIHSAAADAADAHTVALNVWFEMASSNEYTAGTGRARGRGYAKWREEERERRAVKIAADEVVEVDGKVSRGTQTIESNFQKEKPMAVVKPNNHLRDAVAWRQQQ